MGYIVPKNIVLPGGERIRVRCAAEGDAAALLEHRVHMATNNPFSVIETDEIAPNDEKTLAMIREHQEKHGHLYLIAHEAELQREAVAGGAAIVEGPTKLVLGELTFRNGSKRKVSHQGEFGIGVHADWRGRGIGRVLIETLVEWAAAHDTIEKIFLGALATNTRAIRLYKRLGFRKEGLRRSYFKLGPGCYVDDVVMSKWVKPVELERGGTR